MTVDTKKATLLPQHQMLHEPHPTTNSQSCFKHQILSESNKNCKILQNNHKKSTHEVSGNFNIIWPNFTLPTAEQKLPMTVKPKTLTQEIEHTVGLKMPLEGSTSNFRPFRHRLAQKGNNHNKVSSPGGDSDKDIKSSIRAYGWSQNTSKRLYV